jgi:cytochrome oxidase assembly protein ShyY1
VYRFLFAPKWIGFHLLVVVGIVTMINLGFWQLRRLDDRQAFNATVEARYDAAPEPVDVVLADGVDPADVEWLPVIATGTYLDDETIRVVNRSQNGRAGDNVVVPLRLADGRLLLVNRGFIPLGFDAPAAPRGEIAVAGRLRQSQERRTGQLSDPSEGALYDVQRVDIDRLTPQLDAPVLPMYIDAYQSRPADDPVLEPVLQPDLSDGPHLSYAVQWFLFAGAVAVGWVLAVRKSIRTRQRQLSAPLAQQPEPEPTPTA